MINPRIKQRQLRVLDFDCECRPLAWYGGDFVTKQPTVIAWKFIGERAKTKVAWIGASGNNEAIWNEEGEMIEAFREAYDAADVVTGHYIRGFDLPLLNGSLMRLGLPALDAKLSQDTKLDLARAQGVSKSQENLGAMFELAHPKYPMNTSLWAEANVLTQAGIKLAKERCVADVEQHIEMRAHMLGYGLLRAPCEWSPEGNGKGTYAP